MLDQAIMYLTKKTDVPYIDSKSALYSFLSDVEAFKENIHDYFPVGLYVSASPTDGNTVGVLVFYDGKIELFEGNDEASEDTYNLVDKLIGGEDKEVLIWGNHDSTLVRRIKETGRLPAGLYVSPNRQHASGHYELDSTKERNLFSGKINLSNVRQESEVDWKTKKECVIKQVRIY